MKKILLLLFCVSYILVANAQTVDYPHANLIEKGEWEKAENKIIGDYQKDSSDVLNCYALYKLLSSDLYPNRDDYRAYCCIVRALNILQNAEEKYVNKLKKKNVTIATLQADVTSATQTGFLNARAINTIDSYEAFLTRYAASANEQQIKTAQTNRNRLEFNVAKKANTIGALQAFIDRRPEAEEIPAAIKLRNSLAFSQAQASNTIEAFESFIREYPDAKEVASAHEEIHRLAFSRASAINTIDAYQDFVTKYPTAEQVGKAKKKIHEIAYKIACDAFTEQAFADYIEKYPESEFVAEAMQKKEIAKLFDGGLCDGTYSYYEFQGGGMEFTYNFIISKNKWTATMTGVSDEGETTMNISGTINEKFELVVSNYDPSIKGLFTGKTIAHWYPNVLKADYLTAYSESNPTEEVLCEKKDSLMPLASPSNMVGSYSFVSYHEQFSIVVYNKTWTCEEAGQGGTLEAEGTVNANGELIITKGVKTVFEGREIKLKAGTVYGKIYANVIVQNGEYGARLVKDELNTYGTDDNNGIVFYMSPDLAFFGLHGQVKKMTEFGSEYEFDKNGKLIKVDGKPASQRYIRDGQGRIVRLDGFEFSESFLWNSGRLSGSEAMGDVLIDSESYTYDERGYIVKIKQHTVYDEVSYKTFIYSDIDKFGNWRSRTDNEGIITTRIIEYFQ